MRAPAVLCTLAALLALASVAPRSAADGTELYRSDEIGLALEPIPDYRRDEFPWVLSVEGGPGKGTETRRLFSAGVEQRRWVTVQTADGRREEREYTVGPGEGSVAADTLVARRLSGTAGELLQEELFAGGKLASRTVYQYREGELAHAVTYGPDGSLLSAADFLLSSSGRLREVRWTAADGARSSAAQVAGTPRPPAEGEGRQSGAGLAEERTSGGAGTAVIRYDGAGRVVVREVGRLGEVVSRERLRYDGDARTPSSSTMEWPREGRRRETTYDGSGAPLIERTTVSGAATELVQWRRDEQGRALEKRRTTSTGVELWRYAYGDDGSLAREEHLVRGAMVKATEYTGGRGRTEELYADGAAFMRVFYDGDRRLREQVLLDGEVVRERFYE